ncbi:hypothetical protein FHR81_003736 [Actinoalloteichus hoggarensis]|uniref:Uncharacterized protein n=1 Tax=Actinoalloteichus hoggarensis TaxID=1470176 RepID=A0A221WBA7_9PSEU|nr:hypothetical protein [Actinoalloteichus hoggarensis]ASO23074.1 hypothetical protein AHOG_27380 [Actinoalloteichus hoggarensis]MBB5922679.1 hypothetical protein [Actinoalloteichus hoggarensis]
MQIRKMLAKTLVAGAIVVAPVLAATPAMAGEHDKGHGHSKDNGQEFRLDVGEWNTYKIYSDLEVKVDFKTGFEFEGGDFAFASIDF